MIPDFLCKISAKNYRNRIVYAKIIASQRWDVFLRHGVELLGSVVGYSTVTLGKSFTPKWLFSPSSTKWY